MQRKELNLGSQQFCLKMRIYGRFSVGFLRVFVLLFLPGRSGGNMNAYAKIGDGGVSGAVVLAVFWRPEV